MDGAMPAWTLWSKQWDALVALRFSSQYLKAFRNATIALLSLAVSRPWSRRSGSAPKVAPTAFGLLDLVGEHVCRTRASLNLRQRTRSPRHTSPVLVRRTPQSDRSPLTTTLLSQTQRHRSTTGTHPTHRPGQRPLLHTRSPCLGIRLDDRRVA